MSLLVNLRHLVNEERSFQGELPVEALDLRITDELIHANHPLEYEFSVQKFEKNLLLHGRLLLVLDCECARCLKPFQYPLELENWAYHVPLEGEDSASIVNDCVDLTPYIREDILLQFPQHPLCDLEYGGLQTVKTRKTKSSDAGPKSEAPSAWSALDKLKF